MSEGLVDAVKMEGGRRIEPMLRAVLRAGIPVMGHVGLTPQTAASMGGNLIETLSSSDGEVASVSASQSKGRWFEAHHEPRLNNFEFKRVYLKLG